MSTGRAPLTITPAEVGSSSGSMPESSASVLGGVAGWVVVESQVEVAVTPSSDSVAVVVQIGCGSSGSTAAAVVVGCSGVTGASLIVVLVITSSEVSVAGPAGAVASGSSVVDGANTVGGVGPGPVLGGVESTGSVVTGGAVVLGAVVTGAAVVSGAVVGGAVVVGAAVVEGGACVVGRAAVVAVVSLVDGSLWFGAEVVATNGPAGGEVTSLGNGPAVVVGRTNEAVLALLSGKETAVTAVGVEPSSETS